MADSGSKSAPKGAEEASRRPQTRRPVRLPFDGRRQDAGGWIYDHRAGLAVTIIVYLVVAIGFVGTKIATAERRSQQGMVIDLGMLEELERERDRLQEEVQRRSEAVDWRSIRNLSSNENALNENLKDDRGTNTSALNESAEQVEQRMRANREAYERGMAEARSAGERHDEEGRGDTPREDRKLKGRVTVSFSLVNPVRYSRDLVNPAYRCEGGGEVVVRITVDRSGKVIAAQVLSGGDECMRQTAVSAALGSLFDINNDAPARQTGTMTYVFIPQ